MRKLITANFHRFSKDRFSWCVVGIVVILSLASVFNSAGSFEAMAARGYAMSRPAMPGRWPDAGPAPRTGRALSRR